MSANTDLIESVQAKINNVLLPAVIAAESGIVKVVGRDIEIPQQDKVQLKAQAMQAKADVITDLNQVSL